MKRLGPGIIFGPVLVLAGLLFLLERLGVIGGAKELLLGGLLVLAGLGFVSMVLQGQWWAVFPGFPLLAVGTVLVLPRSIADVFGGPLVLGSIGLSFLFVFMLRRKGNWWALIPAGVLATLAIVAWATESFDEPNLGGLLFFGLAATFLAVALLERLRWALYPAAALATVGLLAASPTFRFADYLFGGILIVAGTYLVIQYWRRR